MATNVIQKPQQGRDPASLALLGSDRRASGIATLGLEPRDHLVKGGMEALDLRALAPCRGVDIVRARQINLLHRGDQTLERVEPSPQQ